jgi:hypothetical protein
MLVEILNIHERRPLCCQNILEPCEPMQYKDAWKLESRGEKPMVRTTDGMIILETLY